MLHVFISTFKVNLSCNLIWILSVLVLFSLLIFILFLYLVVFVLMIVRICDFLKDKTFQKPLLRCATFFLHNDESTVKNFGAINVSAQNKDRFFFFSSWILRSGKFKHYLKVVVANPDMN